EGVIHLFAALGAVRRHTILQYPVSGLYYHECPPSNEGRPQGIFPGGKIAESALDRPFRQCLGSSGTPTVRAAEGIGLQASGLILRTGPHVTDPGLDVLPEPDQQEDDRKDNEGNQENDLD